MFSISSTVVVEQLVICTDEVIDLVHVVFNDSRESIIVLVASLTSLEEYVRVLSRATENRSLRVESAVSELLSSILVEEIVESLVIPCLDLLDLVRCTETVEEVEERNSALYC